MSHVVTGARRIYMYLLMYKIFMYFTFGYIDLTI
jgi:hypothetical protein